MQLKKNTILIGIIVLAVIVAGYFVFSGQQGTSIQTQQAQKLSGSQEQVQVVKMWVENGQYKFDGSVKAGVPVRLEADMSRMPGCSKSFISSQLGISKTFSSSDNSIEFTPQKSGSYKVACSMNMYSGNLVVN